jgi:hypothetical protein
LTHDLFSPELDAPEIDGGLDDLPAEVDEVGDARFGPSLPIILFSAACGVAGGVIGLYAGTTVFGIGIELSAGVATLAMLFGLGISGAVLSALSGSRAAPVNILFSCGLILLALMMLALCALAGALAGTLLLR